LATGPYRARRIKPEPTPPDPGALSTREAVRDLNSGGSWNLEPFLVCHCLFRISAVIVSDEDLVDAFFPRYGTG